MQLLGFQALPKTPGVCSSSKLPNHGNLKSYLDDYNDTIDMTTRIRWRTQAAGATRYIHERGVIHSDQRPENYLVHSEDDDDGALNTLSTLQISAARHVEI